MSLQSFRGYAPRPRTQHRVHPSETGFTLIEVALAIVVGALVVAGATVLFRQAQRSVQDSNAKQKVEALKTTVEELAQRQGGLYPTLDQLRAIWKNNRPSDYNMSPWSGSITGFDEAANKGIKGSDAMASGTFLGTGEAADDGTTDAGMMYYYRVSDRNPIFMLDLTLGNTVQVKDFGVGISTDDGRRYHHVTGNYRKTGLNPVGGQVGEP